MSEVQVEEQIESPGVDSEVAALAVLPGLATAGNPAWELYGDLQLEAVVTIPLHAMRVQDIRRIVPGTVFHSSHAATDDVLLSIGDVVLANVSFEPAEDKLGIRVNDLNACEKEYTGRHRVTGLAPSTGLELDAVSSLRMPISLCFGRKQWSLRDALALTPGDLISLDRELHGPVSIMARGKAIASGDLLLTDGQYAVRIIEDTPAGPDTEITLQHHRGKPWQPNRVTEPGARGVRV